MYGKTWVTDQGTHPQKKSYSVFQSSHQLSVVPYLEIEANGDFLVPCENTNCHAIQQATIPAYQVL